MINRIRLIAKRCKSDIMPSICLVALLKELVVTLMHTLPIIVYFICVYVVQNKTSFLEGEVDIITF